MPQLVAKDAVVGDVALGVAIHAAHHAGRDLFGEHFPPGHRTVARPAFLARLQVAGVAEEDEVRDLVNANPFDLFAPLVKLNQALNSRAFRSDRPMAQHAFPQLGQAGPLFLRRARMAILALHPGCGVPFVAERNGLGPDLGGQLLVFGLVELRDTVLPSRQKA